MNGVLIDTHILIDYLRELPQAVEYLEALSGTVNISALTVAEIHAGARNDTERKRLQIFTAAFSIIPADGTICEMGGDFHACYSPSNGMDLVDGLIAATAFIHKLELITRNKKHFPMLHNLKVPY